MPTLQKWFWVSALYKAVHRGARRRRHLWQQTVFLIRARDDDADRIALEVAKSEEHEYEVVSGDMVRWVLQSVDDCQELFDAEIAQGTEVYWRFFERVDKPPLRKSSKKLPHHRP